MQSAPRNVALVWFVLTLLAIPMTLAQSAPVSLVDVIAFALAWGATVAAGVRSGLLYGRGRRGQLEVEAGSAGIVSPRLAFGAAAAAAAGALLFVPPRSEGALSIFALHGALLFAAGLGIATGVAIDRTAHGPRRSRSLSLGALLLVDTALPAAAVSALLNGLIGRVRFRGLETVDATTLSRHLAVSLVLTGALLGVGSFLKTRAELSFGLVVADRLERPLPSAVGLAGVLAVAVLLIGPRALGDTPLAVVVGLKVAIGGGLGFVFSALGAARGARPPERDERPR